MGKYLLCVCLLGSISVYAKSSVSTANLSASYQKCLQSALSDNDLFKKYPFNFDNEVLCFKAQRPSLQDCSVTFEETNQVGDKLSGVLNVANGIFKFKINNKKLTARYPLPGIKFELQSKNGADVLIQINGANLNSTVDQNYFQDQKGKKVGSNFSNDALLKCFKAELSL